MKEAVRRGNPEEIAQQIQELHDQHPPLPKEELEAKMAVLNEKLENTLLNYKNANEDNFNLSKALDNTLKVTIDINSFGAVKNRNVTGLSPSEQEICAEMFL